MKKKIRQVIVKDEDGLGLKFKEIRLSNGVQSLRLEDMSVLYRKVPGSAISIQAYEKRIEGYGNHAEIISQIRNELEGNYQTHKDVEEIVTAAFEEDMIRHQVCLGILYVPNPINTLLRSKH